MHVSDSHINTSTVWSSHRTLHRTMGCAQNLVIHNVEIWWWWWWWWWWWCWYQAWIQYGTSIGPMIQANDFKQVQWPILLIEFWARAGILTAVSKRLFRIAYNTQRGVVVCGYSLIRVITPVCCSEEVMTVVVVGAVAVTVAVCGMIIIINRFDVLNFTLCCWKWCSEKLE